MSFFLFIIIFLIAIVLIVLSFAGKLIGGFFNLFRPGSSNSNTNRRNETNVNGHYSSKREYDEDDLVRSEEGEKRMKVFKESAENVDYEEVK